MPKRIKIKRWKYNAEDENLEYELFDRLLEEDIELNDEVEIIEEDKKIEKLDLNGYNDIYTGIKEEWMSGEDAIIVKINELIDEVNKLKDGKE